MLKVEPDVRVKVAIVAEIDRPTRRRADMCLGIPGQVVELLETTSTSLAST